MRRAAVPPRCTERSVSQSSATLLSRTRATAEIVSRKIYIVRKEVTAMSRVIEVSQEALEARREAILSRAGVSLEELRRRAAAGALVGEEWEVWQELCDIAFLLGDA